MSYLDQAARAARAACLSLALLAPAAGTAQAPDDPGLEWGPCPAFMPAGCEITVLHGDPAQPNADIFFKVPGGAVIPRHTHTSAERMVLVSGELQVTYDGHEAVVLTPRTYAYGPPELPHEAVCADGDPCILFIAFEQPIDAFAVEGAAQP